MSEENKTKLTLKIFIQKTKFLLVIAVGVLLSAFIYKTGSGFEKYCYPIPVVIFFSYLTNHSYKFGWNGEYRNKCLEYKRQQEVLPKEERDGAAADRMMEMRGKIILISCIIITILALINHFFNQ